jgi:hypothetical protein
VGSAGGIAQASAAIIVHHPISRCAANRRDCTPLAKFAFHHEYPASCALLLRRRIKKPLPRPPGVARGIRHDNQVDKTALGIAAYKLE